MEDIKEAASAKAFAKLNLAEMELSKIENSKIDYSDYGTTLDRAINYQTKQIEVWRYIIKLIELDR